MSAQRVHAIVVAYHSADQLARALVGLRGQVSITVVDNSCSAAVAAVATQHGAEYVEPGRNLGFAAAVNLALAQLADDDTHVLLLNPDAVVTPSAVSTLAAFLELPANARIAAVSPRLIGTDGAEQKVLWPFPAPLRMWAEAVGLAARPARGAFAVGAVLLLSRKAINDVGIFDERFFLYAEETDWQRRASARGWTSAVCSDVVAEHEGGGASKSARRREILFHAAQETYIRKWYGPTGWGSYRIAALLGASARAVILTGGRRKEAARRVVLYFRGPVRCARSGLE